MRLKFTFSARVLDKCSGANIPAPDAIDGSYATTELLADYLDAELADLGVCGGEVRVVATNGTSTLDVVYWVPDGVSDELVERLRLDTIAQLDDGIGEGGFQITAGGGQLIVFADTDARGSFEVVNDGRIAATPSHIAIAARDGDLKSLVSAVEADSVRIDSLHQGHSGLHLAILYGHVDAVRILVAAGANPNLLTREDTTPLELCALSNSLDDGQSCEVAQLLLDSGADPKHVAPDGESAKSYAEARGKQGTANML